MTRIYLVRHGQTEWNRVERFRGLIDVPLNEVGLAQARSLGERLAAERDIAAIYSSPLSRAILTAEPLAQHLGLTVQPLAGINDLNFGDWQGLSPAEVAERWPELYQRWLLAPHTVRFPRGESLAASKARAFATLDDLALHHAGKAFVVVSHKVICKLLVCATLGMGEAHYWQIEIDNASFSVIEHHDGLYVVTRINDTYHLGSRRSE